MPRLHTPPSDALGLQVYAFSFGQLLIGFVELFIVAEQLLDSYPGALRQCCDRLPRIGGDKTHIVVDKHFAGGDFLGRIHWAYRR